MAQGCVSCGREISGGWYWNTMEAPDFVRPGTPEQRMIFQLLERIERLESAQDGLMARVEKGVPFAARDNAEGIIDATEAERSFFVRLYLREEAWAAVVGDPGSEDADDAGLVKLLGDHIDTVVGRTVLKFDFVTYLHFERHHAVTLVERRLGRRVQVKVPVRALEGVVTADSPAVTSALLADAFERTWGNLLIGGVLRDDLLEEDDDILSVATTLSNTVEPCPHPEPLVDTMKSVGAKETAAYRMYYCGHRWDVVWGGEEDAQRFRRRAQVARTVLGLIGADAPHLWHPLVTEWTDPATATVTFV